MSTIDENLKMQKITKLLEKGGTMLAQSHDCGAPMFRFQGKVLCPVCETGMGERKKAAGEPEAPNRTKTSERTGAPERIEARERHIQKERVNETTSQIQGDNGQIAAMTKKKVQAIADSLENETDLHRIKEQMECIELGIRIFKLLRS
jgi:UPF0148 protein